MVGLLLIVLVKSYNENRFITFLPLFVSNRYLKIYGREQSHKIDWFNLLLFVVQILVVTLIASFTLKTYNYIPEDNYILISVIFTAFIILKYFLEKRSEEHTSELQSRENLVCRLLLEQKKTQR